MSQIDAAQADKQFHTSPPVLQANEVCEMAFKGRRDLVLFTTKRLLFIDIQGWTGKKTAFTTVPYSSIKIFQVRTAGSMDKDCEFGFYTEVWFDPPPPQEDPPPPTPGMSYIEFDINRHTTDILGLHRYIGAKVHNLNAPCNPEVYADQVTANSEFLEPSPPGAVDKFLNFFGQDYSNGSSAD